MGDQEKKGCRNCAYSGNVPGNTHISCSLNFPKAEVDYPRGNPHGIANGWFLFPLCYDPIWMIGECQGFATERNPDHVNTNPLIF